MRKRVTRHRRRFGQATAEAERALESAELANSCTATVANLLHASFLAGRSGDRRLRSVVDRMSAELVDRRCVRPLRRSR